MISAALPGPCWASYLLKSTSVVCQYYNTTNQHAIAYAIELVIKLYYYDLYLETYAKIIYIPFLRQLILTIK